MNIDKQSLILQVKEILSLTDNHKDSVIPKIREFIRHFWDFNVVVEFLMTDKNRKWEDLFLLGQFFNKMIDFASKDYLTQSGLINDAGRLYAKAFTLCPIRCRHRIAYEVHNLIDKTYHMGYVSGSSEKFYFSRFVETFDFYNLIYYYQDKLPQCLSSWSSSSRDHRLANVFQLYLLNHIYSFDVISPNEILFDRVKEAGRKTKWEHNTSNLSHKEIKEIANLLLGNVLESVSDEEINWYTLENEEFWSINNNDEIFQRDIAEEIRIQQEEYDMYGHVLTKFDESDEEDYYDNYDDEDSDD